MTKSILPPNASDAERAIDVAGGNLLDEIAINLVRWIKDPELCPAMFLPWLAWEFSVDTWGDDWTEEKKRAAIKRAAYIHRHRGTKAAVIESLSDSPFKSDIIEWFEQDPPGKPYTFRLNVEQKDLPVLMNDHQDLKHAVLRAKNLRSWFSIHVYGRLDGPAYAAGYTHTTEKWDYKILPYKIELSEDNIFIAPGEVKFIDVTVLPGRAEDKSFTATPSDGNVATVNIIGDKLMITGVNRGNSSVVIETKNGIKKTLNIKVVSVTKFVTFVNDANQALFLAGVGEDFTIDYGDGVDSREYEAVPASVDLNWIIPTRVLSEDTEHQFTVKNSDKICFYPQNVTYPSYNINPLHEIIEVNSGRESMLYFARDCVELVKIHEGAFDNLDAVITFSGAFRGCTSLNNIPCNFLAGKTKVINLTDVFLNCKSLTYIPSGAFKGCSEATTIYRLFYGCTSLIKVSGDVFEGCTSVTNISYLFHGCTSLVNVPENIFYGMGEVNATYAFYQCTSLSEIPQNLFNSVKLTNINYIFYGCKSLTKVPSELFANQSELIAAQYVFNACSKIQTVGSGVFKGCAGVTTLYYAFANCSSLVDVADDIFEGCTSVTTISGIFYGAILLASVPRLNDMSALRIASSAFYSCSSLESVPPGLFENLVNLTTVERVFYQCANLNTISARAFAGCTALTTLLYAFTRCTALKTISSDAFADCKSVNNLTSCFMGCSALEDIPDGLFDNFVALTDGTNSVFNGCTDLKRINPGLFAKCTNLLALPSSFAYCTSLTALPEGLFDANLKLSNLSSTFSGCSSLAGLPAGLFDKNPSITTLSSAFTRTGIVDIPAGIFDNLALLSSANYIFAECKGLKELPDGLFANNPLLTNLNNAFNICTGLESAGYGMFGNNNNQLNIYNIFYSCGLLSSSLEDIFTAESYPSIVSVVGIFGGCSEIKGSGLDLIAKLPAASQTSSAFTACFSLDDYKLIPAAWGGPA